MLAPRVVLLQPGAADILLFPCLQLTNVILPLLIYKSTEQTCVNKTLRREVEASCTQSPANRQLVDVHTVSYLILSLLNKRPAPSHTDTVLAWDPAASRARDVEEPSR